MADNGDGSSTDESRSLAVESIAIAFYSVAGTVVTAALGALAVWLKYVDSPTLKRLAALNLDLLLLALCLCLFPALTAERPARTLCP